MGFDQISTGNVIGFLVEAYERGMIEKGKCRATQALIEKIDAKEGVGALAAEGVWALSWHIGKGSDFNVNDQRLEYYTTSTDSN